jgi:hypothetical protein
MFLALAGVILMALPNSLREQAFFGGDILASSEMGSMILSKDQIITGPLCPVRYSWRLLWRHALAG